jgi:hypothetical protein
MRAIIAAGLMVLGLAVEGSAWAQPLELAFDPCADGSREVVVESDGAPYTLYVSCRDGRVVIRVAGPGSTVASAPGLIEIVEPPARATDGFAADAASHRAMVFPTAHTLPEGAWSLGAQELLYIGLDYGATDRLQLELHGIPLFDEDELVVTAGLKYQLLRQGAWRVALHGMYGTGDGESASMAGGIVTACLEPTCHSTANVTAHLAVADDSMAILSTAIMVRVSPSVKVLGEILGAPEGGAIGLMGMRLGGRHWALDLGAAALLDDSGEDPIPWLSLAYRGGI